MDWFFDKFFGFFFGGLLLFFAVVMLSLLIYLPTMVQAEAKCLEAGYPKSAVAYNFKAYCMNLDGSIRVEVKEVK